MKQGQATSSGMGSTKREPIVHAINVGGVSEIGNMVAKNAQSIHAGRGFTAPAPVASTTSNCGSQGRHK